jgi:hypothetical protein
MMTQKQLQFWQDVGPFILMLAAAVAIAIAFGWLTPAKAQNTNGKYTDGKYAVWYSKQYAKNGGWCCDLADGHAYNGNYDPQPDGSVILRGITDATDSATGKPVTKPTDITIQAFKVLDGVAGGPNPTGHAVLWSRDPTLLSDAGNIFCFSPGPLG